MLYEMLLMKLRPSHLKGSEFGTVGGSHRIALTPGIPLSDSVVLFIWLTVSTSLLEFRYALTWFLIVAAFQSNDPFQPWGSEKSLLNAWDVKEPTHLTKRVGHEVPGVVAALFSKVAGSKYTCKRLRVYEATKK